MFVIAAAVATWISTWAHPSMIQFVPMATGSDPLPVLLNYGGLGVGIIVVSYVFMSGKIHTTGELDGIKEQLADVRQQRDRLAETLADRDDAIRALVSQMTNRTLPTLADVAQAADQPQAAGSGAALGKLEALISRAERVLGDERST